ncbi:MAG: thermonuclease family protein [Desulfobulbaceae bacterium]|nr:thermonuclease family protein [Desulfobulbaceae bacterium]
MIGIFAPSVPKQNTAPVATQVATSTQTIEKTATSTDTVQAVNIQQAEATTTADTSATSSTPATSFLVTHVVDGDTFDVDLNGKTERIRMIGVDTPETVDPRKPVQCFGKEASDKMKELIAGKRVVLEADPTQGERDKYGRLLRYPFLPDGTNVGLYLIQEGYAHEYTYNLPYKYQQIFKDAENAARIAKKGLWADNACPIATPAPTTSNTPSAPSTSPTTAAPSPSSPTPAIPTDGPAVKKSNSGICHQRGTTYYNQTKNYTAYDSLKACLDSGGRMPK